MSSGLSKLKRWLEPASDGAGSGTGIWVVGFATDLKRETLDVRLGLFDYVAASTRAPGFDSAGMRYFTVRCAMPHSWSLSEELVDRVEVTTDHPLLTALEAHAQLHATGQPTDIETAATEVEALCCEIEQARITLNKPHDRDLTWLLGRGHGVFATGAASSITRLAGVLERAGVTTSCAPVENPRLVGRPAFPPGVFRQMQTGNANLTLLRLGKAGHVIAHAFDLDEGSAA